MSDTTKEDLGGYMAGPTELLPKLTEKQILAINLIEAIAKQPDGNAETDVSRALLANPAAIRPLYRALTGDKSTVGRMQAFAMILQKLKSK